MSNKECQFEASTQTSSATVCKWCGQEKWQHKSKLDLNKLEEKLDDSLNNETSESLHNWLDIKRKQCFIEQEFIPNQEALLMREIGFDEPCLKYKWNDAEASLWMSNSSKPSWFHKQDFWTENDLFTISIPTYSQCFKWLREKHGYLSYIDIDNYSFYRYTIYKGKCISEAPFETYEEAELACLKKIIEIVKNNTK